MKKWIKKHRLVLTLIYFCILAIIGWAAVVTGQLGGGMLFLFALIMGIRVMLKRTSDKGV